MQLNSIISCIEPVYQMPVIMIHMKTAFPNGFFVPIWALVRPDVNTLLKSIEPP